MPVSLSSLRTQSGENVLRHDRRAGNLVRAKITGVDVDQDAGVAGRVGAGEVDALGDGAAAARDVELLVRKVSY